MNSVVKDTLNKLKQCDDFHNRCDYLLEHSEITYLLEYIQQKENIIKEVREEVKIYEEQSNDGTTNELDNYVFIQRLKNLLDEGESND